MATTPSKPSVVIVYTGDGKGKTSASIGLTVRALGAGKRVAFVQFIKAWTVSEHKFFARIAGVFNDSTGEVADLVQGFRGDVFTFYKGGKGFFNAGKLSAKDKKTGEKISETEHETAARETLAFAKECATSGDFDLVICDEINNAVNDGLLTKDDVKELIDTRNPQTSLCLTGRNWPTELNDRADIITEMKKQKHHYDDGFLAEVGIDF